MKIDLISVGGFVALLVVGRIVPAWETLLCAAAFAWAAAVTVLKFSVWSRAERRRADQSRALETWSSAN